MTKGKERVLTIPQPVSNRLRVTVEGTSPLLVHAFSKKTLDDMEAKKTGQATGKRGKNVIIDPVLECEDAKHFDSEGREAFPGAGLKNSMVRASASFHGWKMTVFKTLVKIPHEMIPLKCNDSVIDRRMVRLNGKASIPRYRPRYDEWSLEFDMIFNPKMISTDQLLEVLQSAGESVGIGDFRPQCNGTFGCFRITKAMILE